jgi:hypothetical protein
VRSGAARPQSHTPAEGDGYNWHDDEDEDLGFGHGLSSSGCSGLRRAARGSRTGKSERRTQTTGSRIKLRRRQRRPPVVNQAHPSHTRIQLLGSPVPPLAKTNRPAVVIRTLHRGPGPISAQPRATNDGTKRSSRTRSRRVCSTCVSSTNCLIGVGARNESNRSWAALARLTGAGPAAGEGRRP